MGDGSKSAQIPAVAGRLPRYEARRLYELSRGFTHARSAAPRDQEDCDAALQELADNLSHRLVDLYAIGASQSAVDIKSDRAVDALERGGDRFLRQAGVLWT